MEIKKSGFKRYDFEKIDFYAKMLLKILKMPTCNIIASFSYSGYALFTKPNHAQDTWLPNHFS
ncbi:MAG: hypothetical protein ACREA3_08165, partial [Nitrosotalea sp.]